MPRPLAPLLAAPLLAAALLAVPTPRASAQDTSDISAFFALILTPVGALPPMLTPARVGDIRGGTDVLFRYGRYRFEGGEAIHNLGVTLDLPTGSATRFGLTAGYRTCE